MRIQLLDYDDLNFVELYASDNSEEFKICNSRSKFLNGSVFSIFQHCFELSHVDYSYYDVTRYDNSHIVSLRNHLMDEIAKIKKIDSAEGISHFALKQVSGLDFLNELKSENINWKISWENIRNQLADVGESLIEIVDQCIDEDKELIIKGY